MRSFAEAAAAGLAAPDLDDGATNLQGAFAGRAAADEGPV